MNAEALAAAISFIGVLIYSILFLFAKAISSPKLQTTAKNGAIDVIYTFVILITLIKLINSGLFLDYGFKIDEFSLQLASNTYSAPSDCVTDELSNLTCWYKEDFRTPTHNILLPALFNISYFMDLAAYNVDNSYSFKIGGRSSVINLQGIGKSITKLVDAIFSNGVNAGPATRGGVSDQNKDVNQQEKDAEQKETANAISNAMASSTTVSQKNYYTFISRTFLAPAYSQISSLYTLAVSIDSLISLATNTKLILSFLFAGAFLRMLSFSKGAGAFLMAFAITIYIILPMSVVYTHNLFTIFNSDVSIETSIKEDVSTLGNALLNVEGSTFNPLNDLPQYLSPEKLDNFKESFNPTSASSTFKLPFYLFAYSLILGFSLLMVVSGSAGLSQLFGVNVSVWIVGRLTYLV